MTPAVPTRLRQVLGRESSATRSHFHKVMLKCSNASVDKWRTSVARTRWSWEQHCAVLL